MVLIMKENGMALEGVWRWRGYGVGEISEIINDEMTLRVSC